MSICAKKRFGGGVFSRKKTYYSFSTLSDKDTQCIMTREREYNNRVQQSRGVPLVFFFLSFFFVCDCVTYLGYQIFKKKKDETF